MATGERETVTFVGLAMTQPLLRDAGKRTATAAIRVAASESEQAWQDFRRQLMVSIYRRSWLTGISTARPDGGIHRAVPGGGEENGERRRDDEGSRKGGSGRVSTASAGVEERMARLSAARQRLTEAKAVPRGSAAPRLPRASR